MKYLTEKELKDNEKLLASRIRKYVIYEADDKGRRIILDAYGLDYKDMEANSGDYDDDGTSIDQMVSDAVMDIPDAEIVSLTPLYYRKTADFLKDTLDSIKMKESKTPRRILDTVKNKKKAGQAGSVFLSTPSNDARIESGAGFSDGIGFQEEHDSDTRHKDGHDIPEPDPADGPVPPVVDPIAFKKVLFLTGDDAKVVIDQIQASPEDLSAHVLTDFIQSKFAFTEYPEVSELPIDSLDMVLDTPEYSIVYNPDLKYVFVYQKIFDAVQEESIVKEANEETISPDFVKDNAIDFSDDSKELEQNKEETPPEPPTPEEVPEEVPAEEPPAETPPVEEPKKDFRKGDKALYVTKDKSKVKGKITDSVSSGSYIWFNFVSHDGVVDVWTKDTSLEPSDAATEAM